jgi:hypothetical protein
MVVLTIDTNEGGIMLDVRILHKKAARGKPMSIPDEAMTIDFQMMDISFEISDEVRLHLVSQ